MNDDQQKFNTQINLAEIRRNAGRDYHEHLLAGSLEVFMATQPQQELDRLAVDNPYMFRHRFGIDRPKKVRQQLLDIQHKCEWSDREIRMLRIAGLLRISHTEVQLKPGKIIAIGGWVQIVIISMACISMDWHIGLSTAPIWKQLLGELLTAGFWFVGVGYFATQYIQPWYVLKRATVTSAT